jgi:anti-sigma B factor antagonist
MNLEFKQLTTEILSARVLESRMDANVSAGFRQSFEEYLAKGTETVVIEMEGVSFIDSTGMGALISLRKALPAGGELVISGANETVTNLLRLTRLNKVFMIVDDVQSALDKLGAKEAGQ